MDTSLTQVMALMFKILGGLTIAFATVTIAFGFGGDTGFARGWNSRKKQGIILGVAGALMMMISGIAGIADEIGYFTSTDPAFSSLNKFLPGLGLGIVAYGIGQFALNMINDDFGSRTWGIRLFVAGMAVAQLGKVIEFVFAGL